MKRFLSQLSSAWLQSPLMRRVHCCILSGIGLFAGTGVVYACHHLQRNWSETGFLVAYLTLFTVLVLGSVQIRVRNWIQAEFTVWAVIVFACVGLSRIVTQLMHWEYDTGYEPALRSAVVALCLGTASLTALLICQLRQQKRKSLTETHAETFLVTQPSVVTRETEASGIALSAHFEETHLW